MMLLNDTVAFTQGCIVSEGIGEGGGLSHHIKGKSSNIACLNLIEII